MPIKWDDSNKLKLLLKILEKHPIGRCDLEFISKTWPGPEKPTPRAIYEQIKLLKKQAEQGGGMLPARGVAIKTSLFQSSSVTGKSGRRTTVSMPRSMKASKTAVSPLAKMKRPVIESEEEEEEEEEEAEELEEGRYSSSDDTLPPIPSKRRRLSRSSSSVKSYYQGNGGSSGEDAAARDSDTEQDGEFDYRKHLGLKASSSQSNSQLYALSDMGSEMQD